MATRFFFISGFVGYCLAFPLAVVGQSDSSQDQASPPQTSFEKEVQRGDQAGGALVQQQQRKQEQLDLVRAQAEAAAEAQIKVDEHARELAHQREAYEQSLNRAIGEYPGSEDPTTALGKAIKERFANMSADDPLWQDTDRPEILAHQEAEKLGIKGTSELDRPSGGQNPQAQAHTEVGTAFFVTTNGYLLTDYHVVKDANLIQIKVGDGLRPAKLAAKDPINDIAILKVEGNSSCLPLGNSGNVTLGQPIYTMGFPNPDIQGLSPKLTRGEISSLDGFQDDPRMYQISAPIQPGNSGGCLVDDSGNVVGIISSKLNAMALANSTGDVPQNVNYALKISYAKLLLESLDGADKNLGHPNSAAVPFEKSVIAVQQSTVMVIAQ